MLVLVRRFSCTPDDTSSEFFLLHTSGFVSVQTHQTAQSWYDLVRTLIVLFSEEFLLHSSGYAVLERSFSYTPRAGFIEEFLLHSSRWFLLKSFSSTPQAGFSEEFLFHSSSWF